MYKKENSEVATAKNRNMKDIPILNIRMMTDEEWNRLAYRNRLERQVGSRD